MLTNDSHNEGTSYSPYDLFVALRKACSALALPALQFVFLRVFVKEALGLEFAWKGFTDWDFIFAVPMALAVVFLVLDRARKIELRWNLEFLCFNLSGFVLFLVCNFRFETLSAAHPELTVFAWTALACGTLVAGFFARVNPLALLQNANRWVLIPGLLIALTNVFSQGLLGKMWAPLSRWAAKDAHFVLNHTIGHVEAIATTLQGTRIVLKHPDFGVSIGRGCGGLDAFVLFFLFMFCLRAFRPKAFSRVGWVIVLMMGVPIMYLLNVLRISSFFFIAVGMRRLWAPGPHEDLVMALFHSHAGWLLYSFAMLFYFQTLQWTLRRLSDALKLSTSLPSRRPIKNS